MDKPQKPPSPKARSRHNGWLKRQNEMLWTKVLYKYSKHMQFGMKIRTFTDRGGRVRKAGKGIFVFLAIMAYYVDRYILKSQLYLK